MLQMQEHQVNQADSDNDAGISKEYNYSEDGSTFSTQIIEDVEHGYFLGDCSGRPLDNQGDSKCVDKVANKDYEEVDWEHNALQASVAEHVDNTPGYPLQVQYVLFLLEGVHNAHWTQVEGTQDSSVFQQWSDYTNKEMCQDSGWHW